MPAVPLLVLVAFTVLFYRAATYERMTGWVWAITSAGLSLIVMQFGGIGFMIVAQVGLFGVMWWYNVQRKARPKP